MRERGFLLICGNGCRSRDMLWVVLAIIVAAMIAGWGITYFSLKCLLARIVVERLRINELIRCVCNSADFAEPLAEFRKTD